MDLGQGWDHELAVLKIMLEDRKYTNIRKVDHGEDPVLLYTCKDNMNEITHVYFSREIKLGVKIFRKIRQDSIAVGGGHLIIICKDGLTPFAQKELLDTETPIIEIFKKKELCVPVIHHKLVPPHIPLTQSEKKKLLIDMACSSSSLPKMKETDAVAKYMNFQRGTVVKIIQQLGTLEAETKHRIVV